VSTRSGDEEIWLARLDRIDDRFVNISRSAQSQDRYPAWSKDGSQLAWSAERKGDRKIVIWDPALLDRPARQVSEGDRAAWSPDGAQVFAEVRDPQGVGLAAFDSKTGRLSMPLISMPGALYGMTWITGPLVGWLADGVENPDQAPAAPLWQPALTRTVAPAGRKGLVSLGDVTAPQALLQDEVDEAFVSLRQQIAKETGWDALSSLENGYVPLTTPLTPSIQNDWLYTGRAFAVNPLLQTAGWLVITKEDFSGQVYWNVYLKARYQDGSMGMPLTEMVWEINARYNGDPQAFELGGRPGQAPAGYWIDLTEMASRYGWERLPSWTNWKTFYPSIRFNQFVMPGGLDWSQAMAEMYPIEALHTPTSVPTVTLTPTETPKPTRTPVLPTATATPTLRATATPLTPSTR
jgi:TolB protein